VLPASVADDAERLARFQREAEVLAALNHPHIAAIYGLEKGRVGQDGREGQVGPFLVMELVEGLTIEDMLASGSRLRASCCVTAKQAKNQEPRAKSLIDRARRAYRSTMPLQSRAKSLRRWKPHTSRGSFIAI
jgi:serine/threonine protein kinase